MGTVFTFLFAIGIILVTKYAGQADIDADCVLHGELAFIPLQQSSYLQNNCTGRRLDATIVVHIYSIGFLGRL